MQDIADLFAGAAVADVGKRFAEIVTQYPQRHDALVHLSHLPGSGNDAAAIDGRAQPESGAIFLNQAFAGKLGQPIKRAGTLSRAGFLHALR